MVLYKACGSFCVRPTGKAYDFRMFLTGHSRSIGHVFTYDAYRTDVFIKKTISLAWILCVLLTPKTGH